SILFLAAFVGGGINAVAGGGTFLLFPILMMSGVAPFQANATSTMALWPGSLASSVAYRKELIQNTSLLPTLIVISLIGGAAGALTLLLTPEMIFRALIPWLLLLATLIFTFGRALTRAIHRATAHNETLLRLRA